MALPQGRQSYEQFAGLAPSGNSVDQLQQRGGQYPKFVNNSQYNKPGPMQQSVTSQPMRSGMDSWDGVNQMRSIKQFFDSRHA